MSLRYLLDTDWVIHFLNGNPQVVRRVNEAMEEGAGLSIVSLAELYEGVYYSTDPEANEGALNAFLRGVVVLGVDERICQVFGRERGRLRAGGKTIGDFDLLIGSTALHHSVPLLTNNRRHFEMIEGLHLVSL